MTYTTLAASLLLATAAPAQRTPDVQLDSLLATLEPPKGPGYALGVVRHGTVSTFRSAGWADVEAQVPFTDSTVFGIASITKQFTAACVWSLVQQGRITLDDDLRTHLPELPDPGDTIRIRHALNHTTGMRNYHALMDLAGFDYDSVFHDNSTILELAARQRKLNHRPGERVIYGNTAYPLLAIVIERVSGQDLNTFAQHNLFRPLGMHDTFYSTDLRTRSPRAAHAYTRAPDGRDAEVAHTQITYGAGGMCSSVRDLAIWSTVLAGKHPAFRDLSAFLVTQDPLVSGAPSSYARGVMVNEWKGFGTIHHSGYALGGRAQMITVPEEDLAVIVLTNTAEIDPAPLAYGALDLYLVGIADGPAKAAGTFQHAPDALSAFAGHYQEMHSDMTMDITTASETLWAQGAQARKPQPLVGIGRTGFVRANNDQVRYEFDTVPGTTPDLIIYQGAVPFYFARAERADTTRIRLQDFIGTYRSEELDVNYRFSVVEGRLSLSYPGHTHVPLSPRQRDAFGNGQRVLYCFMRDAGGAVDGLVVASEGTVKDIHFLKQP